MLVTFSKIFTGHFSLTCRHHFGGNTQSTMSNSYMSNSGNCTIHILQSVQKECNMGEKYINRISAISAVVD